MSNKNLGGYMTISCLQCYVSSGKIKGERNGNLPTRSLTISLAYRLMHNLYNFLFCSRFCYMLLFRQKHAHKFNVLCYSNQYNSSLVKWKCSTYVQLKFISFYMLHADIRRLFLLCAFRFIYDEIFIDAINKIASIISISLSTFVVDSTTNQRI